MVPTSPPGRRRSRPEQAMSRLDNVAGISMNAGGHSARVVDRAKLRSRAIHFNMAGALPAALQGFSWPGTSCCGSSTPNSADRPARMLRAWSRTQSTR